MRKFKKAVITAVGFIAFVLLLSAVWYVIDVYKFACAGNGLADYPDSFFSFLMFIIGYGDVATTSYKWKAIMSVIGLLSVSLLSSIFTVSLFEFRSKMSIKSKMLIGDKDKNNHFALIHIRSKWTDIYNLKLTLLVSCGNEVISEEKYIPFIPKHTDKTIYYNIAPGTVVYKYLRSFFKTGTVIPILVLTAVYTDIGNGQEYTVCKKYQYTDKKTSNIVFTADSALKCNYEFVSKALFNLLVKADDLKAKKATTEFILNNTFNVDLRSANPINAADIDMAYGYQQTPNGQVLSGEEAFKANVHMTSQNEYQPQDFCMVCIRAPLGGSWTKYYDMGCNLNFDCKVIGNIAVSFEFKPEGNVVTLPSKLDRKLSVSNDFQHISLRLSSYPRDVFEKIAEICFTVFYRDVDSSDPTGTFIITNCALEVEK